MPKNKQPIRGDQTPGALEHKLDMANFLRAYWDYAGKLGLNPNPFDPRHFYDYYGYWKSQPDEKFNPDRYGHLSSEFKKEGNPRKYIRNKRGLRFDTSTGEQVEFPKGGVQKGRDFFIPAPDPVHMLNEEPGGPALNGPRALLTRELLDKIAEEAMEARRRSPNTSSNPLNELAERIELERALANPIVADQNYPGGEWRY